MVMRRSRGPLRCWARPCTWPQSKCAARSNVDHRSDVWSLGVILFRLVTGKAPFGGGKNVSAALASVVADEPTHSARASARRAERARRHREAAASSQVARRARLPRWRSSRRRLAPFGTDDGRAAVVRLVHDRAPDARVPAEAGRGRSWSPGLSSLTRGRRARDGRCVIARRRPRSHRPPSRPRPARRSAPVPTVASPRSRPSVSTAVPSPTCPDVRSPPVRPVPRRSPPSTARNSSVVRSAATDDRY